ncbi:MAG TPA: hypothetical protein VN764_00415 [Polyangiaceae bacterium]|nr:hypothetical protein [Polyangiaceae bacterium]
MASSDQHSPKEVPQLPSLMDRVGAFGVVKISLTVLVFLMFAFFYTILPLAGLQFLPFLFFGCVCLIVGVADDSGAY